MPVSMPHGSRMVFTYSSQNNFTELCSIDYTLTDHQIFKVNKSIQKLSFVEIISFRKYI